MQQIFWDLPNKSNPRQLEFTIALIKYSFIPDPNRADVKNVNTRMKNLLCMLSKKDNTACIGKVDKFEMLFKL